MIDNDFSIFDRRLYQLTPQRIALLRFLVEGYDGVLFLRSLDPRQAVVELSWPRSCTDDAVKILAALEEELTMVEISDQR